jgi:hypothetical protein
MPVLKTIFAVAVFMAIGATNAYADCKCLNRGVEVTEGKTACIKTANGGQMALCEKNLNVTNWKFLGEGCPVAGADLDNGKMQTATAG